MYKRVISRQSLIRAGEEFPSFWGMSYNAAHDELFFADNANKVVRALRVRDNAGDLRDAYRVRTRHQSIHYKCVPHARLGHTTRVFAGNSRSGRECRELAGGTESHRRRVARGAPRAARRDTDFRPQQFCALNDSRVLVGGARSRIHVNGAVPRRERPDSHCARPSHPHARSVPSVLGDERPRRRHTRRDVIDRENAVRVCRLRGDGNQLEELARIPSANPRTLLWLADRLLVAEWDAHNDRTPSQSSSSATARDSSAAANSSRAANASKCGAGVQWTTDSHSSIKTRETCSSTGEVQ